MQLTPFIRPRRGGVPALGVATQVACATALAALAQASPPPGYYDGIDTQDSAVLRASLHSLIDDHQRFPYTSSAIDTWDILEQADEDPQDSGAILDVYRNQSSAKYGGGGGGYNREHAWPKSYGFPDDGSQNYPYTDCHHLFLSDESYNSSRSNKRYAGCDASCSERPTVANGGAGGGSGVYPGESNWTSTGLWETWAGRRGDVARALFYLDVRYEGGAHGVTGAAEPDLVLTDDPSLVVTSGTNVSLAHMGELSVLLRWHVDDPVDGTEQDRNDAIFAHQGNRNPFIDHPEWVACAFTAQCGPAGSPVPPSALLIVASPGAVDLEWDDNAEPDLAGYDVWRSTTSGGPYTPLTAMLLGASEFVDATVVGGTTYYYAVSAVNIAGNESALSSEASATPGPSPTGPWINEVHYDNTGTDQQEGFEIAGPAGSDLLGWQVVTYNGNGGGTTATIDLAGVLTDDGSGFGFLWFDQPSLQNGPADGLALVDAGGGVVEFLSYEGSLTASDGPAAAMTSSDIGVSESSAVAVGDSLQLAGQGDSAASFDWAGAAPHSHGTVNPGQLLVVAPSVPALSAGGRAAAAALLLAAAGLRGRRRD
ncbi:MAG: endonuclease [Myxococcota bacterium]|nr:endonuclease [Myxococcota bacterium]